MYQSSPDDSGLFALDLARCFFPAPLRFDPWLADTGPRLKPPSLLYVQIFSYAV